MTTDKWLVAATFVYVCFIAALAATQSIWLLTAVVAGVVIALIEKFWR
jgi:hypothetical protein